MSDIKTAPFFTVDIFDDIPGIKHGFFTRQGGVSEGIYQSLNTGRGSQDNPAHIEQNLGIICQKMNTSPDKFQTLYQTHSNTVHTIKTVQSLAEGDGLVTNQIGIALGIKTADCVPILLACKKTGVIGACHAGWGGSFKGIAQNTVQAMLDLGADRGSIHAAIGPCLHQKNFEVGAEFVDRFIEKSPENAAFFTIPADKEKHHFDLIGYLLKCLRQSGVHDMIETLDFDTYEHEDLFFSYRRSCHRGEPDYGRQLSIIVRTD